MVDEYTLWSFTVVNDMISQQCPAQGLDIADFMGKKSPCNLQVNPQEGIAHAI